jgi:hypothetical protein
MALVEAYFEGGKLYPRQDKNVSEFADPFIAEKYKTHEAFGRATLEEIYSAEALAKAQLFEANTLDSVLLVNDGHGRFEVRPLPRLSQGSTAFGAALSDFNADGHVDLYIAQNYFSPRISIGRMDGGISLLLEGNGNGGFTPILPEHSGLVVPGDAKSLTTVDLSADGWQDVVLGMNDGPVAAFENGGSRLGQPLRVRLRGKNGNPAAIGSRITVRLDDGSQQTAEIYAGDGYMSQSSSELSFGIAAGRRAVGVDVRWPAGQTSSVEPPVDVRLVTMNQP